MADEVVFADTNLFLRYLTNDVPAQAEAVEKFFQRAARGEIRLVTTGLVMAEIVWTLESFYKQPRKRIADMLLAILNTPGLEVADSDLVSQAAIWFADKNVDFMDAYNAAWMSRENVTAVCTFDQKHFERFAGIKSAGTVTPSNKYYRASRSALMGNRMNWGMMANTSMTEMSNTSQSGLLSAGGLSPGIQLRYRTPDWSSQGGWDLPVVEIRGSKP